MSSVLLTTVRAGYYLDSVALMRHSKVLAGLPGVEDAAIMMGTSANQTIMASAGLLDHNAQVATAGDLIVGVRAVDSASGESAMAHAKQLLDNPKTDTVAQHYRPKSLRGAVTQRPDAKLALISVAGEFAVAEARKALMQGLHVMIFSDNVSVEAEIELKTLAQNQQRLVMGPDCGTAIIQGVPLAFANAVQRGSIGIVGASGTGIQEVTCLLDQLDCGISHAIGVGGRDMSNSVGGISTLMALDLLDADEDTSHIVIISKPPAESVVQRILQRVDKSNKQFTFCFLGDKSPIASLPANVKACTTLKDAAESAAGAELPANNATYPPIASANSHRLVALYTGGTLCAEAQVLAMRRDLETTSNVPIPGAGLSSISDSGLDKNALYQFIDLGADEYTQGQPHPMIEPAIRNKTLKHALEHPETGAVVLDVVLGWGSHSDPAGCIAQVLRDANDSQSSVFVSVTGTEADPQCRSRQIQILQSAGCVVASSNADAVEMALDAVGSKRS